VEAISLLLNCGDHRKSYGGWPKRQKYREEIKDGKGDERVFGGLLTFSNIDRGSLVMGKKNLQGKEGGANTLRKKHEYERGRRGANFTSKLKISREDVGLRN